MNARTDVTKVFLNLKQLMTAIRSLLCFHCCVFTVVFLLLCFHCCGCTVVFYTCREVVCSQQRPRGICCVCSLLCVVYYLSCVQFTVVFHVFSLFCFLESWWCVHNGGQGDSGGARPRQLTTLTATFPSSSDMMVMFTRYQMFVVWFGLVGCLLISWLFLSLLVADDSPSRLSGFKDDHLFHENTYL